MVFTDDIAEIEKFIEEAEDMFESVLIYCNNGQNRALVVAVCYLMRRFRWGFKKTLEYLQSKRVELIIKQNFFKALQHIAEEYSKMIFTSTNWQQDFQSLRAHRDEEMLITNTYINSQKIKVETDAACILSRQLKNRSYDKKVKKTVQWADRIKKDKIKAKSTQKTSKSNSSMKSKIMKPIDNLKTKCRLNNIKTELDDSYEELYIKKYGERKKFQLSSSSEFYQKNIRQIQMKILANQNYEKSGKNTINNSFSKSTNIQEDLSNVEKNETNESKPGVFKLLKEGGIGNRRPKQFKDSFLKDFKFLKAAKADNPETEPDINKTTNRSTNQCKSNRFADTTACNLFNKNLDQIIKDKSLKTRALRFDMSKFDEGKPSNKNESVNHPKSLINFSKFDNIQFDSKTDNNYVKTQIVMKKLLDQKNPSFNTSIDPDKQVPILKSNKNSGVFYDKNEEGHKRPSSAPNKGNLMR